MLRRTLIAVTLVVVTILAANAFMLQRFVWQARDDDPRNQGIEFIAYYRFGVLPNELVIDLWSVDGDKSIADVSRMLFTIASRLKDQKFSLVYLAWRGDTRFLMEGDYFGQLGKEYGVQNPAYTIRTMPENMFQPDGTKAFSTWTGGLLAVLGKQMEDFNDLHRRWYINSAAGVGR